MTTTDSAREHLVRVMDVIRGRAWNAIRDHVNQNIQPKCESTIEQLLLLGIFALIPIEVLRGKVVPQFPFGEAGARADLGVLLGEEKSALLIECDGHDWHERTKEQAAKDKRRDRRAISEGHTILHFTGSEIWSDPIGCAAEIIGIADSLAPWRGN